LQKPQQSGPGSLTKPETQTQTTHHQPQHHHHKPKRHQFLCRLTEEENDHLNYQKDFYEEKLNRSKMRGYEPID
jgi:hypothetical protein